MIAQDRRQQMGRVAIFSLQWRGVADADNGLLQIFFPADRLKGTRAANRVGLSCRRPSLPAAAVLRGEIDELAPISPAREAEHDVGRAVPLGKIIAHPLNPQLGD